MAEMDLLLGVASKPQGSSRSRFLTAVPGVEQNFCFPASWEGLSTPLQDSGPNPLGPLASSRSETPSPILTKLRRHGSHGSRDLHRTRTIFLANHCKVAKFHPAKEKLPPQGSQ